MDITITRFSPLQRDLAAKIWACEGADDVEQFIGGAGVVMADRLYAGRTRLPP